jgi:nucleotide-binding universal stress UspA family protein
VSIDRIVVGVDGSAGSRQALRWALDEARSHGADVEAVHAWDDWPGPAEVEGAGFLDIDVDTLEDRARRILDDAVDAADASGLTRPVRRVVARGGPARTLVEASKGADLLVVGSRGYGTFTALLVGSVATQCTHHAACPVVVVRGVS